MGIAQDHALGRNQRFHVERESTAGTIVQATGAGAVKVLKSSFASKQERKNRIDANVSRSRIARITGKRESTWSLECYALPSGTASTAPDIHDLLLNSMGVATVGATAVYTLSDSQSTLGTMSLHRNINGVVLQSMLGASTETMKISASGTDDPKFSFEGSAFDMLHTGYSTLAAECAASATVVVADADQFEVGSIIQVGTSTGTGTAATGTGHRVTAKTTVTLTVTPSVTGTQASGLAVVPFSPTETTAGVPISGNLGSLTANFAGAGALTLPITQFELTLKNNLKWHDDAAFSAIPVDYTPGWRDVTGSISLRARRDQVIALGHYRNSIASIYDLVVTCGSATGTRFVIDIDRAEVDGAQMEVPDADECMIQLPFVAMGSAGADEFTLSFT